MAKKESFGLKEVADVMLIPISTGMLQDGKLKPITAEADSNGVLTFRQGATIFSSTNAAYVFDSLKVSNIEMSSEDTSARGGKGNPELISWSYGKEVTFTMEDALINLKTLHLLFGAKEGSNATDKLTIDANTFPDTYLLLGTTVLRSYATGKDEPFGFIIPKAKINVAGTLTMEADGDPSTFEMTIKALAQDTVSDGDSILVQFVKPIMGTTAPTYRTNVAANATTAVTVEVTGVTSTSTIEGSDDLTIGKSTDQCSITVPSGSTSVVTGNTYHYIIKNSDTVIAYLDIAIV